MPGNYILTLSEYQVGFLRSLFYYEDAPSAANTKVEKIAISTEGDLIVEYKKYGRLFTEKVSNKTTLTDIFKE